MQVKPYVFFDGRCEEALEFYRTNLGAETTMLMRFKESPDKSMPIAPGTENKVMHAEFRLGDSTILASDGNCQGKAEFKGFSLTLIVNSEADADKLFGKISGSGGQVQMPLTKTFFSPKFGMAADKFGVGWMVYVAKK